jgi:hypothetical protein
VRAAVRPTRATFCLLAVSALLAGGCGGGGGGSDSGAPRPATDAKVQIVSPTPNAVTGPDFTVQIDLQGGRVVTETSGTLTPDEGHIHLSLDGRDYVMSYADRQDFTDIPPGTHALQAEFVAKDHAPFSNRPRAFVRFNVKG